MEGPAEQRVFLAIEPRLGVIHPQHIVPVVAGIAQLRPDTAAAAGDGQRLFVGDLPPLVVDV